MALRAIPVREADCGRAQRAVPAIRASKSTRWRALALVLVHALVAVHVAHWMSTGSTLSPLEPSEAMEFAKHDLVNAGLVFFGLTILSTLVLGRWFCGWACHVVALQDLCLGLLKRVGIRPKPLRSRVLGVVPVLAALYMFVWPLAYRVLSGAEIGAPRVELTKTDFWATFPPWPVALATFAVCGFAVVYFLGAKGFCTYACPYGAIFGVVDRFAVGRIRVTDACEGCGHCTATCTSNVIVHEEVRTFGMVVDTGCMKCLDCVSVCPKGALYFGFGAPAVGKPAARRSKGGAGWSVEFVRAAAFLAAFFVFRGLYGVIPFLLALGIAGIVAVCADAFVQMLRRPAASFLGAALTHERRWTRAGRRFALAMAALAVVMLHSTLVQFHARRSARAFDTLRPAREAFLTEPDRVVAAEERSAVEAGLASAEFLARYGLLHAAGDDLQRAWLGLFAGAPRTFEQELRAAAARSDDPAPLHYDLGRFLEARGRTDEAAREYEAALAVRPSAATYDRLARLAWAAGRREDALAVFERAVHDFPERPDLHFNRGVALAELGRAEGAIAAFRQVLALDPARMDARENLTGLLTQIGRHAEARAVMQEGEPPAPAPPEPR